MQPLLTRASLTRSILINKNRSHDLEAGKTEICDDVPLIGEIDYKLIITTLFICIVFY